MQTSDLQVRSTFPIADTASACRGEQVRQSEAMRRCARLIRDEIARGRLVADLAVPIGEDAITLGTIAAILDDPDAISSADAGEYQRLARDLTRALAYTTVDHELADCFAPLSERQRILLRLRNRPAAVPPSFVECGQQIGLGPEGTRMLYHRTARWLAADSAPRLLPRIRSAICALTIVVNGGGTLREMREDLRARGLLRVPQNFDDLLVFWRTTDLEYPYPSVDFFPAPKTATSRASAAMHPTATPLRTLPLELRQKAQRLSQNCGAFSLEWLETDIPVPSLRAMLKRQGYTPIIPGWFWREHAGVNVVATVTRKVCAVTAQVAPRDLRAALARHLSDRGLPAPPTHIVTAVALRSGMVTRRGRILIRTEEFDPDIVLGGTEREVYHVIEEEGPVVSHHTLFETICGRGHAPQTLTAVLQRSPVVRRVAPGRYALIGSVITHADIADAHVEVFDTAGALTYNTDGTVTYSANVGPELLYRGVLDTGSLAAFAGEWQTPAGETITVDERRVQGLKAIVRALALEKGERIAVRFNTWTQTVTVARVADDG